jgi:hypothetical protein
MKRIDVHHHIIPEEYVKRLVSIGITESYGQAFPKWTWTPEKSLSLMKKLGIDLMHSKRCRNLLVQGELCLEVICLFPKK